ncbi:MAG: DUF4249 domain-containing protein [Bacteroidetes bacterium]|jgi:hypothetical protein|nr:DUF4249 domain-containing protein [Bacteroidota bacterium]
MKKTTSKIYVCLSFLAVIVLFYSCEKDITVNLPTQEQKYVVEGYIENGMPAYVLLSKTADYFAPVDSASLMKYMVKDATVIISDGTITDTLLMASPDIGYFYYSPNIIGQTGKDYSLKIITAENKIITAETHMLPAIPLDSVWFKIQEGKDSLGFVWAHLNDPDTLGNCYRWFAKRLGKDKSFIPPPGSVFDDRFINGKGFNFAFNRGQVPNSTAKDDNNDEAGFFKTGDTIEVKFCTITQESYKFWRQAESQSAGSGGPFGSTAEIPTNITGGIGIFEAFNPTFYTVIAKKPN